MIFQGRIARLLPIQSGTSKDGKEWKRQDFVFEYFENPSDRWSDKVVLSVMNENIDKYNIAEGEEVEIGFGHSVREYDGRVFNEIRMYRFDKVKQNGQNPPKSAPQSTQSNSVGNNAPEATTGGQAQNKDDLPF